MPFVVLTHRADLVVIERGNTVLKRNVGQVKRFLESEPHMPYEALPVQPAVRSLLPVAQLLTETLPEPVALPTFSASVNCGSTAVCMSS